MQPGCDVCLSLCLSVTIDQEPIVPGSYRWGDNGSFFLEAQGDCVQEIYELHSGPLAKYPKSHSIFTPKAKILANLINCPTATFTPKGGLQQMFH